jgi:hypothetical protein
MKKITLYILVLLPMFTWAQVKRVIPEKVPEHIRQKIQRELPDHILRYKQQANPEIKEQDYRASKDPAISGYKDPQWFFLPDTLSTSSYQLIFESIEPFIDEKDNPRPNYYLVTKKGHRFTNFKETFRPKTYNEVPAWHDTISLDLYSKYYPADEQYLVYCDSVDLFPVSGNVYWTDFLWVPNFNRHPIKIAFYRTVQFHKKGTYINGTLEPIETSEKQITCLLRERYSNQGHGYLVKINRKPPYDMELVYYTNRKELTGGTGKEYVEVTLPRPEGIFKGYELIKPRIRKVSSEEIRKLGNMLWNVGETLYINFEEY